MAWDFPVIGSIELDNLNVNETSHTVSLAPDRESGDLLLLLMARDGGTDNPSTPSGWTQLVSDGQGVGVTCDCWYKTSDGTEPDTITVSAVDAEMFASVCYNIKAGTWSGTPEVGTLHKANTYNGDPPSVTPSWGSDSTLWIAFMARETNAAISDYPTGFPQYRAAARANSGEGAGMNVCADVEEAASKDPGTFDAPASRNSVSGTIAIKPAASGGGGIQIARGLHGGMRG